MKLFEVVHDDGIVWVELQGPQVHGLRLFVFICENGSMKSLREEVIDVNVVDPEGGGGVRRTKCARWRHEVRRTHEPDARLEWSAAAMLPYTWADVGFKLAAFRYALIAAGRFVCRRTLASCRKA